MTELMLNNPIITTFSLDLVFMVAGILVVWWMIRLIRASQGLEFKNDIWPQIKAGNVAVAIQGAALFLGLCLLASSILGCAAPAEARFSTRYDSQIQESSERFMPGIPWTYWKAQLYQESLLNPMAVSPVGARGLAQFMPATWEEESRRAGYAGVSPHAVGPAIIVGAAYMAKLRRGWSSPRPWTDRLKLAEASYNAGFGSLLKAQKKCGGARLYPDIVCCLPQVTGQHSKETTTYVQRIWKWQSLM